MGVRAGGVGPAVAPGEVLSLCYWRGLSASLWICRKHCLYLEKIPTPMKIKLALPPTPPKIEEFYGHGGFPAEGTKNARRP